MMTWYYVSIYIWVSDENEFICLKQVSCQYPSNKKWTAVMFFDISLFNVYLHKLASTSVSLKTWHEGSAIFTLLLDGCNPPPPQSLFIRLYSMAKLILLSNYQLTTQFIDIITFTCSKWTFICWILAEEGTVNPLWVSIPSIHFISSLLSPWTSLNLSICRPTCSL